MPLFLFMFSGALASDQELQDVTKETILVSSRPNYLMQILASIVSCPLICTNFCGAPNRDPREKNCLHNRYVDPYEVNKKYQNNNCCMLTHYCCPCCVPQQLADDS